MVRYELLRHGEDTIPDVALSEAAVTPPPRLPKLSTGPLLLAFRWLQHLAQTCGTCKEFWLFLDVDHATKSAAYQMHLPPKHSFCDGVIPAETFRRFPPPAEHLYFAGSVRSILSLRRDKEEAALPRRDGVHLVPNPLTGWMNVSCWVRAVSVLHRYSARRSSLRTKPT